MFEGFIQSIETKLMLYATVKNGTYNVRSVSSQENETYFGILSDMEHTRQGCPKATSIPRLMASASELMHCKHDPSNL